MKTPQQIWNEAVEATLREVFMYDAVIPDIDDRLRLVQNVCKRVSKGTFRMPEKIRDQYTLIFEEQPNDRP